MPRSAATLEGEAQAVRDDLQGTDASVRAAVAQASTSGALVTSRAEVADQDLPSASQSQQAADQAAVTAFWSQYYSGFNVLNAQLARCAAPASSGSTSSDAVAASKGHRAIPHARSTGLLAPCDPPTTSGPHTVTSAPWRGHHRHDPARPRPTATAAPQGPGPR